MQLAGWRYFLLKSIRMTASAPAYLDLGYDRLAQFREPTRCDRCPIWFRARDEEDNPGASNGNRSVSCLATEEGLIYLNHR